MSKDHEIPLIDLGPYLDPSSTAEAKERVIKEVQTACTTYGFLSVKGHGVPLEVQGNLLQSCKSLFDLPQEEKNKISLKNNSARRGYEQIREQTLDAKALPDDKEIHSYNRPDAKQGFYIGREIPQEDAGFLRGPNQWPDLPAKAFRNPVKIYYDHMLSLTGSILEILVVALGYDPASLATLTKEPVMNLKLLHYPAHTSKDPMQFGAGAHTDFGALTILLQQPGKDGLQVYHDDEWLPIPAVEDVFVVNIGDLIQKWTDGRYSSTVHRVINAAGGDRYSVPCFYQGDLRATNPFKPDEVDGETVEMHIRKKFDESYGLKS